MDRNKELEGKVAIVTGSARNIGRRMAIELASAGAAVVINAVSAKDLCEEVAGEIEKSGGGFADVLPLVSGKMQDVAWETGDIDAGMITFGMCGGLINDIPSCEELVSNIVKEAEQIITGRLASIVAGDGD